MSGHLGTSVRCVKTPSHDIAMLPGEWWAVHGTDASELEQELQREAPEGHILHGLRVLAVAVRRHLKDVVFWVPSLEQWALVHLTGHVETDPQWPSTTRTRDWKDLVTELDG
jgi:hypothetical protein